MPVSYAFEDKTTGEVRTLAEVDDEMILFMGEEIDPASEHYRYQHFIASGGIGALMQGGFEVTESVLEEHLKRIPDLDLKVAELCREFLIRRYRFTAWR